MKNFEVRCSISGTSALQPEFDQGFGSEGVIIMFPDAAQKFSQDSGLAFSRNSFSSFNKSYRFAKQIRAWFLETEMMRSLTFGSLRGQAYHQVKPWQAVLAGFTFTAFSFASIFLGH